MRPEVRVRQRSNDGEGESWAVDVSVDGKEAVSLILWDDKSATLIVDDWVATTLRVDEGDAWRMMRQHKQANCDCDKCVEYRVSGT